MMCTIRRAHTIDATTQVESAFFKPESQIIVLSRVIEIIKNIIQSLGGQSEEKCVYEEKRITFLFYLIIILSVFSLLP